MLVSQLFVSALAGVAAARPVVVRQTSSVSSEFSQGGCKPVLFAFARGSGEPGNMGMLVGPQLSDGLKSALGASSVATEGINYSASLSDNNLPGGTSPASTSMLQSTLTAMASQCPSSIIISAGYSQGAAVNHRAIEALPSSVRSRIVGVVLFGDTQNQQDGGEIKGYARERTKVICQDGDVICQGTLVVTPAHLTYAERVGEAVDFLVGKVKAGNGKVRRGDEVRKVAVEMVG